MSEWQRSRGVNGGCHIIEIGDEGERNGDLPRMAEENGIVGIGKGSLVKLDGAGGNMEG